MVRDIIGTAKVVSLPIAAVAAVLGEAIQARHLEDLPTLGGPEQVVLLHQVAAVPIPTGTMEPVPAVALAAIMVVADLQVVTLAKVSVAQEALI